ncbi:MAG: hypothetical protein ABL950_00980, partial [Nitrospira sp.]
MLTFGVVFLVLVICGGWYWQYVETQTLHLQERNFRALAVTSHALGKMVTNYEMVFDSVIKGEPPCNKEGTTSCLDKPTRSKAYKDAVEALPDLHDVTVDEETEDRNGFAVKFVIRNGVSSIELTCVNHDRTETKTRWKIKAVINISTIMQELVTEDIFSDVLLADHSGQVLYHHQSARDASGFQFKGVSSLLHRRNDSESKDGGTEKSVDKGKEDLVSKLPLFNEAPIGGISHAIFAQATDLLLDRGTVQTLILMGIVPAGQFHVEARAIPLNPLLLMAGLLLTLFFVLPYVKLRTNAPTEQLTLSSVGVLVVSSFLGTAVLTVGLADFATYRNLEQHLDAQLKVVSEEIRKQFNDDVQRSLNQLEMFEQSCTTGCSDRPTGDGKSHLAQHLCLRMNEGREEKPFVFFQIASNECLEGTDKDTATRVVFPNVNTMVWADSTGELMVLRSREPGPWKYVNLKERQYVRRILKNETLSREYDGPKFWIEPIFSWTTGNNYAVFSMKSRASSKGPNPGRPIVAALEVKLPSVTDVAVPPGMGFALINQDGDVLFHSDARRNLRENLFEETDRDGRLRQAVFARTPSQFDARYWGKDRHFHVTPLFPTKIIEPSIGPRIGSIIESPDVHWSLVTYWDIDMLRGLNLRALYSSGALFLIYSAIVACIGIVGWWSYVRVNKAAHRWVWPQPKHLHRYQIAIWLFLVSLVAVGSFWYLRPHPSPDMLLWGLLPALAAVVVLSISQAEPTDKNKTEVSAQQRYRLAYVLVVTLLLLSFVVLPALVSFRMAVDVEWRLLAKFTLFDLHHDRAIQAQRVREFHRPFFSSNTNHTSKVQAEFFQRFSDQNHVYADFPFKRCWQESKDCRVAPRTVAQRGDERLTRWLYHVIDRPRIGQSGAETDIFLEPSEQWYESEEGTLWLEDRSQGAISSISLSPISSPVPQWLYLLVLALSSVVLLVVLRVRKIFVFTAVICVLGMFLWFGLALAVLGVSALLYGACYVLPMFAAKRVLLLDFPYPPIQPTAAAKERENAERGEGFKRPDGWPVDSWDVLVKEMSGLRNALGWAEIPWQNKLITSLGTQDLKDDGDV